MDVFTCIYLDLPADIS